jgi:cell division protein FtsZ
MISYSRDPQQTIPESSVKIIGLGGAGANILDRATLDGLSGPEMTCVNTDLRTLSSSVATEKIHLGKNLTKGLGSGGDPELGSRAAEESEPELRDALRGRQMVFLCVGLGGGTGSGAAPLIVRIAREEGAFVVVFATMPFEFEGKRRREQADTALNELSVLANAVVTFDNDRMGELVLAKQGIHEAFAACDRMISDSIKAVTRLVVRPGLINIGLGDLMSALSTTRSRCLFGSGVGLGENRSQQAIENALNSPLLDKGHLLADASSVLIHICGDESLTLYEVELLMQSLSKHIPSGAQVLFGVATDPSMEGSLSVTLISAVPEGKIHAAELDKNKKDKDALDLSVSAPVAAVESTKLIDAPEDEGIMEPSEGYAPDDVLSDYSADQADEDVEEEEEEEEDDYADFINLNDVQELADAVLRAEESNTDEDPIDFDIDEDEHPFAEIENLDSENVEEAQDEDGQLDEEDDFFGEAFQDDKQTAQAELELDGGPKGKFEGESPNVLEGEDLDIPPFLRNKKK